MDKIKANLNYYKNKPHFIKLLENITKTENIVENILKKYIDSLEEKNYSQEIKEIEKYIKKFEQKYIARYDSSDGIIYEYAKEWKYFPNKKSSNIENFFITKFTKNSFDEIIIDGIKRNEITFTQNILTDIKHATTCVVIVKKNE